MRAQEDSGIREELNTFGFSKKQFYREKEVVTIYVATSMLWLVGSSRGKNA
jgi:hypothetical protein